jgi:adenosylmethionine-8-amino-7-oxononanoate aminotransferase
LKADFVAAGVWVRPFGKTVYLTPSFTITEAELDMLTATVHAVLRRRG